MHNVWILPLVKLILTVMFEIRKQNLRPRAVVGYGVKIFGRGLFITSPDHLEELTLHLYALSESRKSANDWSPKFETDCIENRSYVAQRDLFLRIFGEKSPSS